MKYIVKLSLGKWPHVSKKLPLEFFVCSITVFYTLEASEHHDRTAHSDSLVSRYEREKSEKKN